VAPRYATYRDGKSGMDEGVGLLLLHLGSGFDF